jgi:D-psicose/D-tagatose/L-ribulose 3-epimerase
VSRLAISNIAWDSGDDDTIAALLAREGVPGVEIAPTKWRERPFEASPGEVAAYRESWEARGLQIVSLQALLFGRPDLQLFGTSASRSAMSDFLRHVIDFAAAVGARAIVFGSPKNRLRGERSFKDALGIAADFFRELAVHAYAQRVAICIEANPPEYGGDFIINTAETVELCRAVDHPGVRVNADLGGMTLSVEDPVASLAAAAPFLGHFHASEPNLIELGARADHVAAARGLAAINYEGWVSIEMRAAGPGHNVEAVQRAIRVARRAYGDSADGAG